MAKLDEQVDEVPFEVSEGFNPKDFESSLRKNEVYVESFCEKYGVDILKVEITMEADYPEVAYTFSDNLGYYTIEGIKASLK